MRLTKKELEKIPKDRIKNFKEVLIKYIPDYTIIIYEDNRFYRLPRGYKLNTNLFKEYKDVSCVYQLVDNTIQIVLL